MASCAAGFENVQEQRDPVDLTIHGTIPSWLSGVLYRTGPGTYRIPTTADPSKVVDIHHWFDGLALHHRFEIHPGGQRVVYRSRKGAEDLEKHIADAGRYPTFSFGQKDDPCQNVFRKFFTMFKDMRLGSTDGEARSPSARNVSVTLTPDMPGWNAHASKLPASPSGPRYIVAKTDADSLQLLDPATLAPIVGATYKDLDPRLDGQLSAAHSCRDPSTGDFYNFSCKIGGRYAMYKVFRIGGSSGKVNILVEITDAPAAYMHSFAMTERFVILCVWGAHFKNYGMSLLYYKNIAQAIDQSTKDDALFYVIDRINGGIVAKYKTPSFFCFHQLNAFDDPDTGDVIIDMSVYNDNSVLGLLYVEKLRHLDAENQMRMGFARRFRLAAPFAAPDPASSSLANAKSVRNAEIVFTRPQSECIELPVIAPRAYHRPYRYAYGITKRDPREHHTFADGLIKLDMSSGGTAQVWTRAGHTPSEPIFVPRPGGKAEDDGVLLSVVLDDAAGRSGLAVLDARDMTEIARAEMEGVYPIGFHGVWCATRL
ncbi:carotenoid oxygenase [Wolfiporia cocos MD-104 SS10]|uniref:Carotenoid oxygenase n=1 Tax=Wolfiporia cocos (strain MD-104) TaxID=742152 RepID=A0A2H3JM13_WOLCO|nr:carotenoid oxygenase [Wolfiporia cocos MD-104 SS10]